MLYENTGKKPIKTAVEPIAPGEKRSLPPEHVLARAPVFADAWQAIQDGRLSPVEASGG